ncbi:WD repeat-containing protein jip5 [Balamuthia mandrillaris]
MDEGELPQLIDALFQTTSRLRSQLKNNQNTANDLLQRANKLKAQISSHDQVASPPRHAKENVKDSLGGSGAPSFPALQIENNELKSTIQEYEEAMEAVMQRHLGQLAKLKQEHQMEVEQFQQRLLREAETRAVLRDQNVKMKESIEQMLAVIKSQVSIENKESLEEECYTNALEAQNETLRKALNLLPLGNPPHTHQKKTGEDDEEEESDEDDTDEEEEEEEDDDTSSDEEESEEEGENGSKNEEVPPKAEEDGEDSPFSSDEEEEPVT